MALKFNEYEFHAAVATFPFKYTPATSDEERKIREAEKARERADQLLAELHDPNGKWQQTRARVKESKELANYILDAYKKGAAKGVAVVQKHGQEVFEKLNEQYQRVSSTITTSRKSAASRIAIPTQPSSIISSPDQTTLTASRPTASGQKCNEFNDFKEIHSDCDDIATERNEALRKNDQLHKEVEAIVRERNEALEKNNPLHKEVEEYKAIVRERNEALEKNSQLEAQCTQLNSQLEDHEKTIGERNEALKKNSQLHKEVEEYKAIVRERNEALEKNTQLEAQCKQLNSQLEDHEKTVGERNEALEKNTQLKGDHEQLRTKNEQLKSENDKLSGKLEYLRSEHDRLKTDYEQLKTTKDDCSREVGQLQTRLKELTANYDLLEKYHAKLQSDHGECSKERGEQVRGLQDVLDELRIANNDLQQDKAELRDQCETLTGELFECRLEITDVTYGYDQLKRAFDELDRDFAEQEQRTRQVEKNIMGLFKFTARFLKNQYADRNKNEALTRIAKSMKTWDVSAISVGVEKGAYIAFVRSLCIAQDRLLINMDDIAISISRRAEELRLMTMDVKKVIKDRNQWKADCMKAQATEKSLREAMKALEVHLASQTALIRDMAALLGPDYESLCG
ncbi:hypothetical protein SLS60_009504 [Paraconiothyrium brasiliense]|uniref:Uncharacterized protein n=1 Tax=Paraconiothyrium brasiliense TaxID=300254 RepID=A0ABR3QV96_9PLEO